MIRFLPGNTTRTDDWAGRGLAVVASAGALLLVLIAFFLLRESAPILNARGLDDLVHGQGWYPLEHRLGMMPMIWGTLVVTLIALLLAAPVGYGAALYAAFYASPLQAQAFRALMAVLAGIPSVVFGLWGLTNLVPLIDGIHPPGASVLAAALVLSLMILPTVMLTSEAALRAVPESFLLGGAALGLGNSALIFQLAWPQAKRGVFIGMILSLARALGETMAVLMVAGNVVQTPTSLFDPVRVLTANIALEMAYAAGEHRAALYVSGLILSALVLGLLVIASLLQSRVQHAA